MLPSRDVELDSHYAPGLAVASTGGKALELARRQRSINLTGCGKW
jgi:hypothetical protein